LEITGGHRILSFIKLRSLVPLAILMPLRHFLNQTAARQEESSGSTFK